MPLFLSETERASVAAARRHEPLLGFYQALVNRVERRAASPGLIGGGTSVEWWHCAAEYLTDAAMARAVMPAPSARLRDVTLSLVRRPVGLFDAEERGEIAAALREKGADLCLRWLDSNNHHPKCPVPDYRGLDPLALHLALAVSDPVAARDALIAAGATLADDLVTLPNGDRLVMLRDPWGFALQLATRTSPLLPVF